jgi:hypothetical protein
MRLRLAIFYVAKLKIFALALFVAILLKAIESI